MHDRFIPGIVLRCDPTRCQAVLVASTLGAGMEESSGECTSRGLYSEDFFPNVSKIAYEGPESTNPLAFHYYNAEEVIMGKPMNEW